MSAPANTVASVSGLTLLRSDSAIPGRARPAAQPHTEFTISSVVPGVFNCSSTARALEFFGADRTELPPHRGNQHF